MDFGFFKGIVALVGSAFAANPILGAVVALIIGGFTFYFLKRSKVKDWFRVKESAGKAISDTGKDQNTKKSVQDSLDDFLDGEGD